MRGVGRGNRGGAPHATKPVHSTTLERLRRTWEADLAVRGLSQPLQLGEGLFHLLAHVEVPVDPADRLAGRILVVALQPPPAGSGI